MTPAAPDAPRGTTVPAAVASVPGLLRVHGAHALDMALTVAACERARPRVANWYLRDVGARPSARGRGVARALVGRRQRDARQAGVGVYLESSTRANVPLYERLRFRETGPARGRRVRTRGPGVTSWTSARADTGSRDVTPGIVSHATTLCLHR